MTLTLITLSLISLIKININSKHKVGKMTKSDFLNWNQRSKSTNKTIDFVYESVSRVNFQNNPWKYTGNTKYNICTDDYKIVNKLITNNGLKEFKAMDIGAGDFSWLDGLSTYLKFNHPNVKFKLYGFNGESCKSQVKKVTNGEIHHLCSFKVEKIESQLESYKLLNQMDLIVSKNTLCHLMDPIGEIQQLVKFIKTHDGILLTDTSLVSYLNTDYTEKYTMAEENIAPQSYHIFNKANIDFLLCPNQKFTDYPFVAITKNADDMELPLKYFDKTTVNINGNIFSAQDLIEEIREVKPNHNYKIFQGAEGRYLFNYFKQYTSFQDIAEDSYDVLDPMSCGENSEKKFIGSEKLYYFFQDNDVELEMTGQYCEGFKSIEEIKIS